MRTIWSLLLLFAVLRCGSTAVAAPESNDAVAFRQALEGNMKALVARVEDLEASNHSLRSRLDDMRRELQQIREETRKLGDQTPVQEQIRRLAESIKDVDAKRRADNEKVLTELGKLAKQVAETSIVPTPPLTRTVPINAPTRIADSELKSSDRATGPTRGIEYSIQSNDTLSGIVAAGRAKGLKLTQKMMMEANPDVNWSRLKIGQKIFIPLPNQ